MNNQDQNMIKKLISNEHNHQIDYVLLNEIFMRRNKQIDLENSIRQNTISFSSSASKEFLSGAKELERRVCDATVYSVYYNELARAYELTGNFIESFQCSYNGYLANKYIGDEEGAWVSANMAAEYAFALKDIETASKWILKRDEHNSRQKFDTTAIDNMIKSSSSAGASSFSLTENERTKDALSPLISQDKNIRNRSVAMRRLRRNLGLSLKKVKKLIDNRLDTKTIDEAIGNYVAMTAEERFAGEEHSQNTKEEHFKGDDWETTERKYSRYDSEGNTIYDGSIIAVLDVGIFRVAYQTEQWFGLTGIGAIKLDEVKESDIKAIDDEDMQKQVITKSEWIHDNGILL